MSSNNLHPSLMKNIFICRYIQEKLDIEVTDPTYREFARIFEQFKIVDPEAEKLAEEEKRLAEEKLKAERPSMKVKSVLSDDEEEKSDDDDDEVNFTYKAIIS